jgi:hypothetical protein
MEKKYEDIDSTTSEKFIIGVKGELKKNLSEIFGGLSISYKTVNNTIISYLEGEIIDQAELIGILNTLFNMRYPIINVRMNSIH